MKELGTYLSFDGQCKAAMQFYQKCLGGELFTMPWSETPCDMPPEVKSSGRLAHARLSNGKISLMASDNVPGMPFQQGNNFAVILECDSVEEEGKLFQSLGDGGKVTMPLQDTFWGAHFGTLTDRFGINWMFSYAQPKRAE